MSDTNTAVVPSPKKPAPDLSLVVPYVINRNGVNKSLTAFAGKRGTWDGVVYQAPQIEEATFDTDVEWFSKSNIIRIVNIVARRMAQDYWDDAIPETGDQAGIFQEATFLRSIAEFAASTLKISELQELYDDAVKKYMSAGNIFVEEIMAAGDNQELKDAAKAKIVALGANVTSIKVELEARKSRRSKEAQTDTVQPS